MARALGALDEHERLHLWALVCLKSSDTEIVNEAIALIEKAGALEGCLNDARKLVEDAWVALTPLVEDSLAKVMLRAFGWYVLERHY